MGMNVSGGSALKSEINVTPLVDVVLVLLFIFMITAPLMTMGLEVELPEVNAASPAAHPRARSTSPRWWTSCWCSSSSSWSRCRSC